MLDDSTPLATIESGLGPISTGTDEEHTRCIALHLENITDAFVRRFSAELGVGPRNMIVHEPIAQQAKAKLAAASGRTRPRPT